MNKKVENFLSNWVDFIKKKDNKTSKKLSSLNTIKIKFAKLSSPIFYFETVFFVNQNYI